MKLFDSQNDFREMLRVKFNDDKVCKRYKSA